MKRNIRVRDIKRKRFDNLTRKSRINGMRCPYVLLIKATCPRHFDKSLVVDTQKGDILKEVHENKIL